MTSHDTLRRQNIMRAPTSISSSHGTGGRASAGQHGLPRLNAKQDEEVVHAGRRQMGWRILRRGAEATSCNMTVAKPAVTARWPAPRCCAQRHAIGSGASGTMRGGVSGVGRAIDYNGLDRRAGVAIETITLGGGCFWCVEAVYEQVDGVLAVESGYSNGHVKRAELRAGVRRQHRPCRGGAGAVRQRQDHAARGAGDLLRRARPDHAESPGQRRRAAVPLGHLLSRHRLSAPSRRR